MDKESTVEVLKQLAEGVHPSTGEIFSDSAPYQHPLIIRSLYSAIQLLEPSRRKAAANRPGKAGKPWSKEEDEQLTVEFNNGLGTKELAKILERSPFAIEARLVKLELQEASPNMAYVFAKPR
ncbi:hypothetical protein [Endozoicomonas numazuensis]|uniref:hypothetical protein n=1 Tax=Endozoicomonas numazuensis TaxID=1137799 RepID=UPI00055464B8|nr:hypothetical protein [Endozoicomonas numazuensis]